MLNLFLLPVLPFFTQPLDIRADNIMIPVGVREKACPSRNAERLLLL